MKAGWIIWILICLANLYMLFVIGEFYIWIGFFQVAFYSFFYYIYLKWDTSEIAPKEKQE